MTGGSKPTGVAPNLVRLALGVCLLGVCALLVRSAALAAPPPVREQDWALVRVNAIVPPDELGGVVVGVVDSGVDGSHPALADRVLLGADLVDGGPGNFDPLGHGTQVAGIIAGRGVGVAPNARILPVRVLDARGAGTVARLARGIRWAADSEARVINASVETGGPARALERALDYAWARRAIVIAIAGNAGGAVQFPAAYPKAVAVGATGRAKTVAPFSGRGLELDLVAPGIAVRTTAVGGGYLDASGTSVAAPYVAGAAALLLGQDPELGNEELVARLQRSARDLGSPGDDAVYGAGLLDIAAALETSGS
jgi:subtilisin family serine protease